MKLRFWLYLLFGAFSILPLITLGYWIQQTSTQLELSKAGERNQMLAETHARTIEQYVLNATRAFDSHLAGYVSGSRNELTATAGGSTDIRQIFVLRKESGQAVRTIGKDPAQGLLTSSATFFPAENFPAVRAVADRQRTRLSPVMKNAQGENVIYLVREYNNRIIAGEMGTGYFRALASATRFARSGHAAIVDQTGSLVAHPKADWEAQSRNIAAVSPIKLALGGDHGVAAFHSPAINAEMLAGYSAIPTIGWAIMVPQEVSDILAQTTLAKTSIATVVQITLALVLLSSILFSHLLSGPLERLITALQMTGKGSELKPLEQASRGMLTFEQKKLEESFNTMVTNLRDTHKRMSELAYTDPVTQLPNRVAFQKFVEESLEGLSRKDQGGQIMFIDVDNFKEINDTHGHHTGDQVLRCLGARMASIIEAETGHSPLNISHVSKTPSANGPVMPCFARFGGDEFVLFLPEGSGMARPDKLLSQILAAINSPVPGLDASITLSGSIGIAAFPEHGLTYGELVKRADIAMYHAKKTGNGTIKRFGDGTGDASAAEIRRDVMQAIANDDLELFYQPKISTDTGEVTSVEALVRWMHPVKGVISPAEFIPAIENTNTTNELGEWVIRRACRDMKRWEAQGHRLDVAVNIATRQFCSDDFVERLDMIVGEEGCEPDRLEIEVTEETALTTDEGASNIISRLHKLGFRVSLDDYGRGYSNLSRLSELRVNTIKIDGPLTARLTRDERTRVIFEATINMARGLHCKTVAEGVETAEEAAILTRLGCTELQGFYFATPLPFRSLTTWIENRNASPVQDIQEKLAASV